MNRRKAAKWAPAVLIVLMMSMVLYAALFTGVGSRTYVHVEESRLVFEQGTECAGQAYGTMNSGPALSVPGGKMKLFWDIESDGENVIRVFSANQAAITPQEIHVSAGRSTGTVDLYSLNDIYDLQIQVDYQDGSYIRVNQIDLTVKRYINWAYTCMLLGAGALVLYVLWARGILTPKRQGELVIVLTAVLIASIPELRGNLHTGHDSEFHMGRLLNLVHALREGQFPARLGAYMQNGYGAVMAAYYPELFLYIPALMMLGGASLTYSYHVFFILMHLSAALSMWYAARRMFESDKAGVAASVLYTLAQYRLLDVYARFAVGEALAMSILPLFALGMYDALMGDRRRWRLLALSAAMICQSHMISTALCGVIAVFLAAVFGVKVVREGRIVPLIKAALFALLLNMFFFLPMYTYNQQGVETAWLKRDLNEAAMTPAQMFLDPQYVQNVADDGLHEYPLGLGLPLILMASAGVYAALTQEKKEKRDMMALVLCVAGVGFAVMSTKLFPWGRVVSLTGGLAEYIQFPWRLLMFTTLCFAFAGGYAVYRLEEEKSALVRLAVLGLCAVSMLPMLSLETRREGYLPENELPYWDQRFADYVLRGSTMSSLNQTEPIVSEGIVLDDYRKMGSSIDAKVSCQQSGSIVFPLYAFEGYVAELDGKQLAMESNETRHMRIDLEQGMEGRLEIRFEGKEYWHIGDAVSLAALIVLLAGVCLPVLRQRRR